VPFSLGHSKLGFPSMDAQHNIYLHLIVQAALLCRGCEWVFILWMWLFNVPEICCLSRDEVPLDYYLYRRIIETGLMLGQLIGKKLLPLLGCRAVQAYIVQSQMFFFSRLRWAAHHE
jgi:hypothetical protein